MNRKSVGLCALVAALASTNAIWAAPLGTAFTYQGSLKQSGASYSGSADFAFRVWDAAVGGTAQTGNLLVNNVQVTDGVFTVSLDFGKAVFNNEARWLEISVRAPAGGGLYQILNPRQPISPTPYAIQTRGLFVDNSQYLGVGTLEPEVRLHVSAGSDVGPGIGGFIQMGEETSLNVAIDNNEIMARDNGAPSTLFLNNDGGGVSLTNTTDGQVGVGTSAPTSIAKMHVTSATYNRAVMASSGAGGTGSYGVYAESTATSGTGVRGVATTGSSAWGVWGSAPDEAGHFTGDVVVTGSLSKGGGSFKIDHPTDPANKYFYHSFVESPDMMNIYNGVVTLNAEGAATVELPDWFESINRDFRYSLTPIGAPGPDLYIAEEVSDNAFAIAGGEPGIKVSWQVTGIRQDKWANAHRIPVVEEKPAHEKGLYLHPHLWGKTMNESIEAPKLRALGEFDTEPATAAADADAGAPTHVSIHDRAIPAKPETSDIAE